MFDPETNEYGVTHTLTEEDGVYRDVWHQDVQSILDRNHEMAMENSGYNHDKTFRRVASIPLTIIQDWKNEKGIDIHDAESAQQVMRLLNSNEYYKLRTAHWQL